MLATEIKRMPVKDKLILMEEIWDSLRHEEIKSPSWHKDVLGERLSKINNGEAKFISIDELKMGR